MLQHYIQYSNIARPIMFWYYNIIKLEYYKKVMFPSAAATNNPSPGTKTQVNSRIQNHALTYISCVCVPLATHTDVCTECIRVCHAHVFSTGLALLVFLTTRRFNFRLETFVSSKFTCSALLSFTGSRLLLWIWCRRVAVLLALMLMLWRFAAKVYVKAAADHGQHQTQCSLSATPSLIW